MRFRSTTGWRVLSGNGWRALRDNSIRFWFNEDKVRRWRVLRRRWRVLHDNGGGIRNNGWLVIRDNGWPLLRNNGGVLRDNGWWAAVRRRSAAGRHCPDGDGTRQLEDCLKKNG